MIYYVYGENIIMLEIIYIVYYIYYMNILQEIRDNKKFFLIAGPCVIESRQHALDMCASIKTICDKLGVTLIYKSSFDKANRTSVDNYRGLDFKESLDILREVKETYNVPICTDIHESWQCQEVAKVADVLQIPAFLCRQTDLLIAAGKTGAIINIKKGQFANCETMKHAYNKVLSTGNDKIWLTDRGTMHGYDDLIVDYRNLVLLRENKNALVLQDITHSLQQPNRGSSTQGLRYLIPTIARASVAVGVDGLFMEVHDNPQKALSDAATQWPLNKFEELLVELLEIHNVTKGRETQYI